MNPHVKLSDIIENISLQTYETSCYLNKETAEVVLVSEEELRAAEEDELLEDYPEWQKEQIELARDILANWNQDKYIALPDKFDIHEYRIMERFCLSIDDEEISDFLHYDKTHIRQVDQIQHEVKKHIDLEQILMGKLRRTLYNKINTSKIWQLNMFIRVLSESKLVGRISKFDDFSRKVGGMSKSR